MRTNTLTIEPDTFVQNGRGVVTLEPPPPTAPSPPAKGVKKVSFGGIKKAESKTKTVYPLFPDLDGRAAEIAARIIERTEEFETLDGALKTDKAELKFMVAPHYFEVNRGRHEVPSSISVNSPKGEVLVTFQNKYSCLPDDSALLPILGDETGTFFRQSFEFSIKGDNLPADNLEELINDLQSLFARYECPDALEVTEKIKPTAEFHAARHVRLTPDANHALEQIIPIQAMVKTKGRK